MIAERDEVRDKIRLCLIMLCFFGGLLIAHAFIYPDYGDDLYYKNELAGISFGSLLQNRYNEWSSRFVIDAVMILLIAAPRWVWKILDCLVVLLLIWNTVDLFGMYRKKLQASLFLFAMMWITPILALRGAGWVTTTTNYLWPLSFGLVALRPLKHLLCKEKCPTWEYLAVPLCVVYSANLEQMAAILLGAYLVVGFYQVVRGRKLSAFYFVCIFLVVGMLCLILSCPGNQNRLAVETERYLPQFAQYSIWEKLFEGFIENGFYYAAGGCVKTNYLFALLTGVLAARILQQKPGRKGNPGKCPFWLAGAVAFIPLAFYWGVGHFANYWLETYGFRRGGHIVGLLCQNRYLPGTHDYVWGRMTYSWSMIALQLCVYAGLVVCVALTIYFLHGKSEETLLELVILGAGMASHVIVGFSPTIYISGERTALFCTAAILIVVLRNLQIFWGSSKRSLEKIVMGAYVAAIIFGNIR